MLPQKSLSYIYVGLVPVNTDYREIFEHATVGMQLLFPDGSALRSKDAAEIPTRRLNSLRDGQYWEPDPGKELHLHRVAGAEFFWTKDVSFLQATIEELNRSAEALAQEGVLLEEEFKTRNQEARIEAQNHIYDALTGEVQGQLRLMREIVKKYRPGEENRDLLCELAVLGTYDTKKEQNTIIIPHNSKIPTTRSVEVYTVDDNQTKLRVRVTEGDEENVEFVKVIGSSTLSIPPYPKGSPVEIIYAYDPDQTVFIEVIDKVTNQSLGTFQVDRASNLTADQVAKATGVVGRANVE